MRQPTVLIKVGDVSISRKAFILGSILLVCQILDGILTYLGLALLGISMEANTFLRELMHAYGKAPALFATKFMAIALVVLLTMYAHRRRWIRPIIAILIGIYVFLAVLPWTYIIAHSAEQNREKITDTPRETNEIRVRVGSSI